MLRPTTSRLFLAAAVCALLSACGDNPSSSTPAESAPAASAVAASAAAPASAAVQAASGAESTVLSSPAVNLPENAPVVTVVTTGKTKPFSFTEANGSVTGYDIDVISKIGEAEGFRVQLHKRPWQNLFTDVDDGQYQAAISGISFTPERAEKYGLSDSYAINPSILMYTDPNLTAQIKDLKSLKKIPNLRVGVLDGSKHAKQMTEAGVTSLHPYKTTYLLFGGLLKKEVDVIAQDGLLLQQMSRENPNEKVLSFTYEDEKEPTAQLVILTKKGNDALLQSINKGLAKIKSNGELTKIQEKWLKTESK